jgi:glycosyltransferase involved in cell wall biosynthesis
MNDIGISVIIPSFEAWPLLERTVVSVAYDCACQNESWEVVVVDNESGSGTVEAMLKLAQANDEVKVFLRTDLRGANFQPGAARNIGIKAARYDSLIFLDADCIPGIGTIRAYREATRQDRHTVFVGHRRFIDPVGISPEIIAKHRQMLDQIPRIRSSSNYRLMVDRRMSALKNIDAEERPYDLLHGCNFAVHRECIGAERFAQCFDGHWGYEDIELGFRLYRSGRRFRYLPEAFVYHQEHAQDEDRRSADRLRNFALASSLIPGFAEYRRTSQRACPVPLGMSVPGARDTGRTTAP